MIFAGRETERRGLCSSGCYAPHGRALKSKSVLVATHAVFLALLLLCTHSWGVCRTTTCGTQPAVNASSCVRADYLDFCCNNPDRYPPSYCATSGANLKGECPTKRNPCTGAVWYMVGGAQLSLTCGTYQSSCNGNNVYCHYEIECSTQAEADSVKCALDPTAEGCEQGFPDACREDYQKCISLGGVWKMISSTNTECASQCNTCDNAPGVRFRNRQVKICCDQDLAPPDSAVQCYMPVNSGSGMTWSTRLTAQNDEGYSCGQLATASGEPIQENQALYKRFCLDGDRYEEQVDTNDVGGSSSSGGGEGNSSSEDAGHSFGTELEALGGLYGVLDTIRDTLVKRLTPATEDIRDCLYNFKLCTALEPLQIDWTNMPRDTSIFNVDTAILKHIRPMMDSSVKLDSAQLKVLKSLDSLYKKGLVNDSQMRILVNDINGNVDGVETAVKGVKHGIDSLIDSMTTYMDKVGQGIGAVGDSIGAIKGILEGEYDGNGMYYDSAGRLGDSIRHWISTGDSKYDSAFSSTEGAWGVGNIDSSWDSSYAYGMCHGDDCPPCTDTDCLGKITPGILRYGDSVARELGDSLVKNVREQEDSLPSQWDSAFAKLREVSFFGTFDSTFLANVGAMIPNTNTCPEDCFRQDVSGTYAYVAYNMTLDWNLCRPISAGALNGLNAFDILKLLARVITIITCLSILMWEISSRRGGGIGL